jgi:hypothetical protein
VLLLLAGGGLFIASTSVLALDCAAGVGSDFDGDGAADLAIGDPDATVNGVARSGSVYIAYGDGAKQTITQNNILDNDNAAGDRFAHALAAVDWNQDGCSDLLVGTPLEDWANNTEEDTGAIVFIPGSADGLVTASAQVWAQSSFGTAAAEAGDQFGFSIAAGDLSNGTPYFLSGAPGEAVGTVPDAGMVIYATPTNVIGIHQDAPDVPGAAETGDLFGYSVASSPTRLAIGIPGEAIGTVARAGAFIVFDHNGATATPTVAAGDGDQNSSVISGTAEVGDLMGYSVDIVDYRPTSTTTGTLLVVSAPGENGNEDTDGGWVFKFDATGTITETVTVDQGESGVGGLREDGDLFGTGLTAVNRDPGGVTAWDELLLGIGSPGEDETDSTALVDRGWVQAISLIGAPGDHYMDTVPDLQDAGAKWRPEMQLGMWIEAAPNALVISDALAEHPAVYAIPWANLTADADEAVRVYTPAYFGADEFNAGSFGASLA